MKKLFAFLLACVCALALFGCAGANDDKSDGGPEDDWAPLTEAQVLLMRKALPFLKPSAKTFPELIDKAWFLMNSRPISPDAKAAEALDTVSRGILKSLTPRLQTASWTKEDLEAILNATAEENGIGFGKLAAPLRAALAGRTVSPSVYDMMLVIGQDETIARLEDAAA